MYDVGKDLHDSYNGSKKDSKKDDVALKEERQERCKTLIDGPVKEAWEKVHKTERYKDEKHKIFSKKTNMISYKIKQRVNRWTIRSNLGGLNDGT